MVDLLREGEADLLAGPARAEELRSYEFHCGQAAAELGLRRRGGSDEFWARRNCP